MSKLEQRSSTELASKLSGSWARHHARSKVRDDANRIAGTKPPAYVTLARLVCCIGFRPGTVKVKKREQSMRYPHQVHVKYWPTMQPPASHMDVVPPERCRKQNT